MAFKSNLHLLDASNQSPTNPHLLYKFLIDGFDNTFGHLLEETALAISWDERYWKINHEDRWVKLFGSSVEERTTRLYETLQAEKQKGTFKLLSLWTNEIFPVYDPNRELVLRIERVAAPLFGVVTYGVVLLAYMEKTGGLHLWVARRAQHKKTFPGMLESTVGGSLTAGETPFQCLVRESEEEASLSQDRVSRDAVAVSTVSGLTVTDSRSKGEQGLVCPQMGYIYEMKIPEDVYPAAGDDEVEEFTLMSVNQIQQALSNGEITPPHAAVMLDFFIRHGILTEANEPDYHKIQALLHRSFEKLTI